MVPYIDSRGVMWELDPPGSSATVVNEDGSTKVITTAYWSARITSDAYNYKAGQTLVLGDDAEVVRANIEATYATAIPVKRQDAPAGGGSSWLWLLAFLWLMDKKKGR